MDRLPITPSGGQMHNLSTDLHNVLNQTDATATGLATDAVGDSTMRLLAEGVSLSLLWDLVDPDGPASEELLRYEN